MIANEYLCLRLQDLCDLDMVKKISIAAHTLETMIRLSNFMQKCDSLIQFQLLMHKQLLKYFMALTRKKCWRKRNDIAAKTIRPLRNATVRQAPQIIRKKAYTNVDTQDLSIWFTGPTISNAEEKIIRNLSESIYISDACFCSNRIWIKCSMMRIDKQWHWTDWLILSIKTPKNHTQKTNLMRSLDVCMKLMFVAEIIFVSKLTTARESYWC